MIIVENLEEFSEWLLYEYEHAYELVGDELLITNVKDERLKESLKELGIPFEERSVVEIIDHMPRPWVVLDPKGEGELTPDEASGTVVVGGILGAHPPKGRTWELLTSKLLPKGVLVRNLGPEQFSIDGAVAVAWLIKRGKKLSEIEKVVGLEVEVGEVMGMKVVEELPYAYPVIGGGVFFSEKVKEYLKRRRLAE
ncbi:Protein of unknown function DUF431 [Ignicoccus hospitalis KIN4/I]|uniref:Uncharacterized protein n=1 Tax=Ignicoccus hospitalis (strain KIN4/I / DSM 18386 / JCM 14125) TaxID=453591 RepID=A8ABQ8_IGNH4|nr:Protein of unknown function DUF431 [Ignicoccus hospitalis KIN4/I]HIH89702.1 hypothetical protein [Desulfurococcaceae archaeon]